ncbi:MAG TPA: DNA alkylation repair protein, partial [Chitinophagaceae bacterium]|nr:DNA alkylation repair protein [Chitinophagaceae bacterium]
NKFSRSKNLWQRRLSLVMVEWYTRKKEHIPEIKELVASLENDKEYYVKKAVSWLKRNFEKKK